MTSYGSVFGAWSVYISILSGGQLWFRVKGELSCYVIQYLDSELLTSLQSYLGHVIAPKAY